MKDNSLGLTQEERTVFYKDADGKSLVGEIRYFDSVYGLLGILVLPHGKEQESNLDIQQK